MSHYECVKMDVFKGWKGEVLVKRVIKSKDCMPVFIRFDYWNDLIR